MGVVGVRFPARPIYIHVVDTVPKGIIFIVTGVFIV
jgi:hypothetical protein